MTKKRNRPKIPIKIQLKLWVKAGGRCEFYGCNDIVYRDGLTLSEVNWSNIAHIISWTPKGPRGHPTLSVKLAKEFSNLMLMCNKHAGLIDTEPYIKEYPTDRLRKIKEEHEKRIEIQTSIKSEAKTHVLILQSNIGENPVEVNHNEVKAAVIQNHMYPSEELPYVIDLTGDVGEGEADYYLAKTKQISNNLHAFIDKYNATSKRQHISIFPLALMPLLVFLGKELGDKHSIQLFQHRRTAHSWIWKDKVNYPKYIINLPAKTTDNKNVYLKIALSDYINEDKLASLNGVNKNIYEITISKPTTHFLVNREQLSKFDKTLRQVLNEIQHVHGKDVVIHLLLAVPCPIAVQCGMTLLIRKDPKIMVYDYNSRIKGFINALTI